jgi:hypothetical protein
LPDRGKPADANVKCRSNPALLGTNGRFEQAAPIEDTAKSIMEMRLNRQFDWHLSCLTADYNASENLNRKVGS